MSRVGKQIITLPTNTELKISGGLIEVKGPKGNLSRDLNPLIEVRIDGSEVTVHPKKQTIEARALWGTYASHISNMVQGVNEPFVKKLILEGVGFKSEVQGNKVLLALGFSHPVEKEIPEGLTVTAEKNLITVSGSDKEQVGQFAAQLRSLKKPEPYKGKGMRYEGELIRRKQGKKSV